GLQLTGRMRGAWTLADYDTMARDASALQRDLDMPIDVLTKSEVRNEVATDLYQGGLLFRAHGGVHPALLQQGLLATARAAGARVASYTPVPAVRGERGAFVVETTRGRLEASEVVAATNGYTGRTTPGLARRLVAIPSFLIATEPLGENRVRELIPHGR